MRKIVLLSIFLLIVSHVFCFQLLRMGASFGLAQTSVSYDFSGFEGYESIELGGQPIHGYVTIELQTKVKDNIRLDFGYRTMSNNSIYRLVKENDDDALHRLSDHILTYNYIINVSYMLKPNIALSFGPSLSDPSSLRSSDTADDLFNNISKSVNLEMAISIQEKYASFEIRYVHEITDFYGNTPHAEMYHRHLMLSVGFYPVQFTQEKEK